MFSTILLNVDERVANLGEAAIDRLMHNIVLQIGGVGFKGSIYKLSRDRLYIVVDGGVEKQYVESLTRVFGIKSIYLAIKTSIDIASIINAICSLFKLYGYSSIDVFGENTFIVDSIRGSIIEGVKRCIESAEISSASYSKRISIEIVGNSSYIYGEKLEGVGGIPYGFIGRVASLLSGGIDSTIATWAVMRMGFSVTPIHFNLKPFYGDNAWARVLESLKWLRGWVAEDVWETYIVPLGAIHNKIDINCRYRCMLCKMLMYRISWELAKRIGCRAIVTGEALGQVASQTLHNLKFLTEKSGVPIIRPLISFDKNEIVEIGRRFGLDKTIIKKVKSCTLYPALWGKQAVTHANNRVYQIIEEAIKKSEFGSIDAVVDYAISNTSKILL